jgi:hypothetical protein
MYLHQTRVPYFKSSDFTCVSTDASAGSQANNTVETLAADWSGRTFQQPILLREWSTQGRPSLHTNSQNGNFQQKPAVNPGYGLAESDFATGFRETSQARSRHPKVIQCLSSQVSCCYKYLSDSLYFNPYPLNQASFYHFPAEAQNVEPPCCSFTCYLPAHSPQQRPPLLLHLFLL